MPIPWILIAVAGAAIVIAILALFNLKKHGWKREVDYKQYFHMGIIWVPVGVVFTITLNNILGLWFLAMGIAYLAVGLKHKDTWGKPQKISIDFQKKMAIIVGIGVLALVAGILIAELYLL